MNAQKIANKWTTVAIVGFNGSVRSRTENKAAHGGVCRLQARSGKGGGMLGRKVNVNGAHEEIGESFALDSETLAQWEMIAKSVR
jgi:hypothetical protein